MGENKNKINQLQLKKNKSYKIIQNGIYRTITIVSSRTCPLKLNGELVKMHK